MYKGHTDKAKGVSKFKGVRWESVGGGGRWGRGRGGMKMERTVLEQQ